jgi:malate dehydrogenase
MTYLACKTTGFPRNRVMGMAGVLDSSRLSALVASELGVRRSSVVTQVLGSHGDTMVPLISHTSVSGKPVSSLLSGESIARIIKRTRERGAEIVSLLGTGSAFYSPSASVMAMLDAILNDTGRVLPVCALLDGEYGIGDICIGVPCSIGKGGIIKVVEAKMSAGERAEFDKSAKAIRSSIGLL